MPVRPPSTPRSRRALVALLAVVALAAVACGADDGERHDAAGKRWRGVVVDEPRPTPDIVLRDTDGAPFDLRAATAGRLALLFFGYTSCPDACPLQMAGIAGALESQAVSGAVRAGTDVIFVTTDPARDTPERIRTFLDQFNARFIGLTGTPEELVAAQQAAGITVAGADEPDADGDYLVGHATQILAFTPDGLAHVVYPAGIRQVDWAHDLPQLFEVPEWQAVPA